MKALLLRVLLPAVTPWLLRPALLSAEPEQPQRENGILRNGGKQHSLNEQRERQHVWEDER